MRDPEDFAADALFREFAYLTDLIKMYRALQLQALALCITLYTAALAIVGAALGKGSAVQLQFVASYATLWLPYFGAVALLAYGTMEVRIRRASLYIQKNLAPLADTLAGQSVPVGTLLRYEDDPSLHLHKPERLLSTSSAFVFLMSAPAIMAGWWHWRFGQSNLASADTHPKLAFAGVMICCFALMVSGGISLFHELRLPSRQKAKRAAAPKRHPHH